MEHFSRRLDKYAKPYDEQVKQYLVNRLQKYREYATILNDKVEAKYRVDASPIDKLLEQLAPQKKVEGKKEEQVRLSNKY